MAIDDISIKFDGEEIPDELFDLLQRVEIELSDEFIGMVRMQIGVPRDKWDIIDDDRFSLWKSLTIEAGFEGSTDEIFSGYITHVHPVFTHDESGTIFEISAMDKSITLDRIEILKDWPDKKDSDIASEILTTYGFTPDVDDTEIIHDEKISTIIQRETDFRFLKRLAVRNGFAFYIEGDTGVFKAPVLDESPQPLLVVLFDSDPSLTPNLINFSLNIDALQPVHTGMSQIDRTTKEVLTVESESGQQELLGADDNDALLPSGMEPPMAYIGMNVAINQAEMTTMCQGVHNQSEWLITGSGEIDVNSYGHVLMPRRTVTIKGIGEKHSGVYYVSQVTHVFTFEGITTFFTVKRNGIGPTGDEDFSSGDGLF